MKLLKRLSALLVVLLLFAAGVATWLIGTEAGLRFALVRAAPMLPLEFDPQAAEGSLVGPIRLPALAWADDGTRVALRAVELDWRPVAALRRRLEIDYLRVAEVVVELPAEARQAAEPGPAASDPALPWPVNVGMLHIAALEVQRGGEALVAGMEIELAGRLHGDTIEVDRLRLVHPQLTLAGSGEATLDPAAPLRAEFDWSAPYQGHTWAGHAALAGPVADLEVAVTLATPLAGSVAGRVRGLDADPAWDLAVSTEPLPAEGPWPSQVAGLAATLEFSGRQTEGGFAGQVAALSARLADSTVTGSGSVGWDGRLALDLVLAARGLDPSTWVAGWPGRLDGDIRLQTPAAEPETIHVQLEALSGELRGVMVGGSADVYLDPAGRARGSSALELDGSRVSLTGRVDRESVELEAGLAVPDIGTVVTGARGTLAAQARMSGALDAPAISLEAQGRALAWNGLRSRVADLRAEIDLAGEQRSEVWLELSGVGQRVGRRSRLELVGTGTPAAHEFRLEFSRRRPEQSLVLALDGSLADAQWRGTLQDTAIAEAGQVLWQLEAPAPITVAGGDITLRGACLDGIFGLLCLDGAVARAGPWRGQAALAGLDLARVGEWLNLGLQAAGSMTGGITVSADEADFTALSGGLGLGPGEVRVRGESGPPLLAWDGGALELGGDPEQARGTLRLLLAAQDHFEAGLAIGWNETDPPLDGTLTARLTQLGLIRELVPELAELGGRMELGARLGGTLGDPAVELDFALREGLAYLPGLGIRPHEIELDARLAEDELSFSLAGRSGDGRFEGTGEFDLGADGVTGAASLQGERVLVADLPDIRAAASPDLTFRYEPGRLVVSGQVDLPTASIRELSSAQLVTPSPDEVIIGRDAAEEEDKLEVRSRVRLTVGPAVDVEAAGFSGRVEGDLLTVIAPEADPWGRGELRVQDGSFTVFGQRLTIETGRLFYDGGPLDNPSLEIRAEREVEAITAGAMVRGTLAYPEISLYSDPPLPRSEILSYLTTGKGLDELESNEQGAVNRAANALVLSGGGLVMQDLARRLGLEGLSVSATTGPDETALVVSQYLGSGLYVSYGVGLFDTVNTLRLRYQVNRRLSLEATSGEEEAAEIFYTFERD